MTTIDPKGLPAVHAALINEATAALYEYIIGEELDELYRAKIAIGVLYHYVLEGRKVPNTSDDVGDILNHGRCVE
jgi:hypothetical protein